MYYMYVYVRFHVCKYIMRLFVACMGGRQLVGQVFNEAGGPVRYFGP